MDSTALSMQINTVNDITEALWNMQDKSYKEFHSKLMPTIDPDTIIGVRTPVLRKFANEISATDSAKDFIITLPHSYYEENNLHSFLISSIKDFDVLICEVEKFLPYINNWATCDSLRPKAFAKNHGKLLPYVMKWLDSDLVYTKRFAIGILHSYYLDDKFKPEFIKIVSKIESDEYYINMMIAWYLATALSKQYDSTIPYLESNKLSKWVHNKTIQKSIESFRITDKQKDYLRTLRIK